MTAFAAHFREASLLQCADGFVWLRRLGARGSRRDVDGSDDRRLDRLGKRLVFEVQFERLPEVDQSLIEGLRLARHLNLEAPRHTPGALMRYGRSESHDDESTDGNGIDSPLIAQF